MRPKSWIASRSRSCWVGCDAGICPNYLASYIQMVCRKLFIHIQICHREPIDQVLPAWHESRKNRARQAGGVGVSRAGRLSMRRVGWAGRCAGRMSMRRGGWGGRCAGRLGVRGGGGAAGVGGGGGGWGGGRGGGACGGWGGLVGALAG